MSEPHRHHFVPAFYLRQWHGPDEKLVEYTIKHRKLIPKPVSAEATGFQRDLYEFRELPSPLSQFLEKEFFNYSDRTAADALKMLLDGLPKHLWSSETLSAWARFLIGVHTRHFDTIPEIRDAAKSLWVASGEQSQRIYEDSREPGDPATFDDWIALRDPLIPHKAALDLMVAAMDNREVGQHIIGMQWEVIEITGTPRRFLTSDRPGGDVPDERPDRLDHRTYIADQAVRRGQRHQIPERFSSAKRSTDCGSDQRGSSRPGTTLRVGDQPVALAGDVHPRPHEHEAGEAAVLPVARKLPRT
jgi:hypothetical protein